MEYIHITPDIDTGEAHAEIMLNRQPSKRVTLTLAVTLDGKEIREVKVSSTDRCIRTSIDLNTPQQLSSYTPVVDLFARAV